MAESKFTHEFKHNLSKYLNIYFNKNGINLNAISEYKVPTKYGNNLIDIAIVEPECENRIVGIEIEIKSSTDQIFLNRDKFRNWVFNSKKRKGALLQIIYDYSNISLENMHYLLKDSYKAISDNKNFYYEFYALKNIDLRESDKTASILVNEDWEFDARFQALIYEIFNIEY